MYYCIIESLPLALTLTNSSELTPGVRRRTLQEEVRLGAVSLTVVVVLLALVISLIYLAHANRVATRGYAIKKLEIEKTNLITENEIWRQQVSEAKSLATIQSSGIVKKMVPVKDATYIKVTNGTKKP